MAYNVTGLVDFVKEQDQPILKASILGAKTASLFTLQTGIKSSAQLNLMYINPTLQSDGVGSAVDGASDVVFSQRKITVAPIAVREFLDPKALNAKFTQYGLKAGSDDNELGFEQEIMDLITGQIAAKMETALWQGNTALTGNADLKWFDGYVKLIDAASGVAIVTGATASNVTVSNVIGYVDALYTAIPVAVLDKEDMAIYMGRDMYRTYTLALKNANLFNYGADSSAVGEITVPSTDIKIYALNGLNGSNRIFAGRKSNFFVGCDLEGEEDTAHAVYLDATERVKIKIGWKYGAQIAFPSEIATFKLV